MAACAAGSSGTACLEGAGALGPSAQEVAGLVAADLARRRSDRQYHRAPLVASRDDEFVRRARQDLEVALDGARESRLLRICGVFGLSEFERDILILLLLHAIKTKIARLCSAMPDSDQEGRGIGA